MSEFDHQNYYAARAASARYAAQRAAAPYVAAIHNDLAKRYDLLSARSQDGIEEETKRVQAA